jgi:hypothetical protein
MVTSTNLTLGAHDITRFYVAIESDKNVIRLRGVLDKHTSRKNAMFWGFGPGCDCEDCRVIKKVIKSLDKET